MTPAKRVKKDADDLGSDPESEEVDWEEDDGMVFSSPRAPAVSETLYAMRVRRTRPV